MQVVFRGDPVELARGEGLSRLSLDLWGVHFPMNQAVDVSHLPIAQQQKLARNPHFEVLATAPTYAAPENDDAEQAEIEALKARSTKRAKKE